MASGRASNLNSPLNSRQVLGSTGHNKLEYEKTKADWLGYLDIKAYAVSSTHLKEDAVVDYGQIGMRELGTVHCVTTSTGRQLQNQMGNTMKTVKQLVRVVPP